MTPEQAHLVFVVTFIAAVALRVYWHTRVRRTRGPVTYFESRIHLAVRVVLAAPLLAVVVSYMVRPALLDWATLAVPGWVRWFGAALMVSSVPLLAWVHATLGNNFDNTLHLRAAHTLVTGGPYRWVRHPMYTALGLLGLGILLLTGNWLLGGIFLAAFAGVVGARVNREEAVMRDRFGAEYERYLLRTGRFFPRVGGIRAVEGSR